MYFRIVFQLIRHFNEFPIKKHFILILFVLIRNRYFINRVKNVDKLLLYLFKGNPFININTKFIDVIKLNQYFYKYMINSTCCFDYSVLNALLLYHKHDNIILHFGVFKNDKFLAHSWVEIGSKRFLDITNGNVICAITKSYVIKHLIKN
ncbi:MAG TPA: hypothetical protein VIK86_08240 [Candidatus Paceibacterota bacterium]